VVEIPEDQPEERIENYGGKDFEKRKGLRREWKNVSQSVNRVVADRRFHEGNVVVKNGSS